MNLYKYIYIYMYILCTYLWLHRVDISWGIDTWCENQGSVQVCVSVLVCDCVRVWGCVTWVSCVCVYVFVCVSIDDVLNSKDVCVCVRACVRVCMSTGDVVNSKGVFKLLWVCGCVSVCHMSLTCVCVCVCVCVWLCQQVTFWILRARSSWRYRGARHTRISSALRANTIQMQNSIMNGPTHGRRRKFIYNYICVHI